MWLKYTDEELWNMTPVQYKSQLKIYMELNKAKSSGGSKNTNGLVVDGFIDQLSGW